MTRLQFVAACAGWIPCCVVDCVRKGYGWRTAVRWTVASHRALWRLVRAG